MDFELTDEQSMLREVSRGMLAASCPSDLVRGIAESGADVDEKLWQLGAEIGWTGLAVPEADGGAGQGVVELALVAEELGRSVAPGPFLDTALTAMALSRSAEADPQVLEALVEGGQRAALAHHGSAQMAVDDGEVVLSGRLTAVHAADSVSWLLVTAHDGPRSALVLVPAEATRRRRCRTLDQTRGWYDVDLTGVRTPPSAVLHTEPADVQRIIDTATVLTSADALGVGERLLEMTVDYVKVREQFDRPLGAFQSVKHKASEMLTVLRGSRAAVYHAAMTLDAGTSGAALGTSVAKAYTSTGISDLAGEALQTHGGIGFTWEHDLHLYLRRAKVDEALYGSAAEHHERIVALLE